MPVFNFCHTFFSKSLFVAQMTSSAGDFAEWHEQTNPGEHLDEGTVVGFFEGKIGPTTDGARLLGVISGRPCVVGNVRQALLCRIGTL